MVDKDNASKRKRMVVEEVEIPEAPKTEEKVEVAEPKILEVAAKTESIDIITDESVKPIEAAPEMPAPVKAKKQKSPIFWILIPGIFLLGAILGGIVFYQKGVNKGEEATPTPTAEESNVMPTPSASPSASVDLTKYTVTILNGSGTAGEAGKVKDLLVTAGFKVGSTGNAATYDYTKTIIKAKSTVDAAFLAKLSAAIAKSYLVGDSETLSGSTTSDIQVIVGTSKAQ